MTGADVNRMTRSQREALERQALHGAKTVSYTHLDVYKRQRVYRRHYSADNCCITLYGKMEMAEKLALLDEHYLSRMPKGTSRPRLTVQDQQNGVRVHIPYYTENPEPDQDVYKRQEREMGVKVSLGHAADNVIGSDLVVYSAAIAKDNVELNAAASYGIPTVERSVLLGYVSRLYKDSICVSGTHRCV